MSPEAKKLYDLLKDGVPHREVYLAGDMSGWYVTYGGGEVSAAAVSELRKAGLINGVYSNCPDQCFHIGKTLDVNATMEERNKHRRGKDAPLIYTDGTHAKRN